MRQTPHFATGWATQTCAHMHGVTCTQPVPTTPSDPAMQTTGACPSPMYAANNPICFHCAILLSPKTPGAKAHARLARPSHTNTPPIMLSQIRTYPSGGSPTQHTLLHMLLCLPAYATPVSHKHLHPVGPAAPEAVGACWLTAGWWGWCWLWP